MAPGLLALLVAVAVALAVGLAWRRANGRMSGMGGVPSPGARAGTGTAAGPRRAGRERAGAPAVPGGTLLTGADLGRPLGQRATLVQFSTAFCAPCRATRRVLAEVAGMTEGVAHVEIDAGSHLELVRRLDIRRTPTVLVIGPDGRITRRASGQPRKADVIAALGDVR